MTDSINCKVKDQNLLNWQLNEEWEVSERLEIFDLPHLYKWSKFKKLRRFFKQQYYKLKYETN